MTENTCSRCGGSISRPLHAHSNYVTHADFIESEDTEVHYALKHTPATRKKVKQLVEETERDFNALAAEVAHPNADATRVITVGTERKENPDGTFVETAKKKEIEFSIPQEKFEKVEVETPQESHRDDVALITTEIEQRDVQKTGLVCPDCVKDDDAIIWGESA